MEETMVRVPYPEYRSHPPPKPIRIYKEEKEEKKPFYLLDVLLILVLVAFFLVFTFQLFDILSVAATNLIFLFCAVLVIMLWLIKILRYTSMIKMYIWNRMMENRNPKVVAVTYDKEALENILSSKFQEENKILYNADLNILYIEPEDDPSMCDDDDDQMVDDYLPVIRLGHNAQVVKNPDYTGKRTNNNQQGTYGKREQYDRDRDRDQDYNSRQQKQQNGRNRSHKRQDYDPKEGSCGSKKSNKKEEKRKQQHDESGQSHRVDCEYHGSSGKNSYPHEIRCPKHNFQGKNDKAIEGTSGRSNQKVSCEYHKHLGRGPYPTEIRCHRKQFNIEDFSDSD